MKRRAQILLLFLLLILLSIPVFVAKGVRRIRVVAPRPPAASQPKGGSS